MCRYAEHVGATFGCVVDAMAKEGKETAFCPSTDATGVAIQPARVEDKPRQRLPCARGHFFVVLADNDHVFFEYRERHTSDAVCIWSHANGFERHQAVVLRSRPEPSGINDHARRSRACRAASVMTGPRD